MKIKLVVKTLYAFLKRYSKHVDCMTDEIVAKFYNNKCVLLFFVVFAILTLIAIVGNLLVILGILGHRSPAYIFITLISPLVATFNVHLLRNASYHLYQQIDEMLGKWID